MESRYKRKRFNKEELGWAINLIEKEFSKEQRNTPEKMSVLISDNFDVLCSSEEIYAFFGIGTDENYELESLRYERNNN